MAIGRPEAFLERWGLQVTGGPLAGGTASLVLPVARADGSPAILKLVDPDDPSVRHEHAALRAFAGRGAVLLLHADPQAGALLLERLRPGVSLEAHPDRAEAIGIVCALVRELWRAPPEDHPFARVDEDLRRWSTGLPARHLAESPPVERELIEAAVAACAELAHPDGRSVIANRDFHLGNVLAAERRPWLLIDPQPVVAEPAFDCGYLVGSVLEGRAGRSEAHALIDRLAGELGLSRERIRLWTLVRAVEDAIDGFAGHHRWARDALANARLMNDLR